MPFLTFRSFRKTTGLHCNLGANFVVAEALIPSPNAVSPRSTPRTITSAQTFSLWSTIRDVANKAFLFSHLPNRPHTRPAIAGVVCSLQSSCVCRQNSTMRIITSKSKIWPPSDREVCRPGRSQIGPRTLLQGREDIQGEG